MQIDFQTYDTVLFRLQTKIKELEARVRQLESESKQQSLPFHDHHYYSAPASVSAPAPRLGD